MVASFIFIKIDIAYFKNENTFIRTTAELHEGILFLNLSVKIYETFLYFCSFNHCMNIKIFQTYYSYLIFFLNPASHCFDLIGFKIKCRGTRTFLQGGCCFSFDYLYMVSALFAFKLYYFL